MPDISVRVGQSDAIKVLSTQIGSNATSSLAQSVIGGIASITSLDVSGITTVKDFEVEGNTTFSGITTFSDDLNVEGDLTVAGIFSGKNGITTLGGITTTTGDLYVGGNFSVNDLSAEDLVVSGIITASKFNTGSSGIEIDTASITGPDNLSITPGVGTVYISGDLNVSGSSFELSKQTITLGDFRIGIASTAIIRTDLDGSGLEWGSEENINDPLPYANLLYNEATLSLKTNISLAVPDDGKFYAGTNVVLNRTTLGTGVVNSSLTSVGTLGSLNVTGILTAGEIDGGSF